MRAAATVYSASVVSWEVLSWATARREGDAGRVPALRRTAWERLCAPGGDEEAAKWVLRAKLRGHGGCPDHPGHGLLRYLSPLCMAGCGSVWSRLRLELGHPRPTPTRGTMGCRTCIYGVLLTGYAHTDGTVRGTRVRSLGRPLRQHKMHGIMDNQALVAIVYLQSPRMYVQNNPSVSSLICGAIRLARDAGNLDVKLTSRQRRTGQHGECRSGGCGSHDSQASTGLAGRPWARSEPGPVSHGGLGLWGYLELGGRACSPGVQSSPGGLAVIYASWRLAWYRRTGAAGREVIRPASTWAEPAGPCRRSIHLVGAGPVWRASTAGAIGRWASQGKGSRGV